MAADELLKFSKMPKAKVDRLARAKANGYERGAHREKDSVRAENKYLEDLIQLQNRVLEDYKMYAYFDPLSFMTVTNYLEDGHDRTVI